MTGGTNSSCRDDLYTETILQVDINEKLQRSAQRNQRVSGYFHQHCDGAEEMLQSLFSHQTCRAGGTTASRRSTPGGELSTYATESLVNTTNHTEGLYRVSRY